MKDKESNKGVTRRDFVAVGAAAGTGRTVMTGF